MQNTKICLIGVLMVAATLIANMAVGRLEIATLRLLPVQTFPRKIGEWQAGEDMAVDPDVMKNLTSAKVVERTYRNPRGQFAQLLLLTATETGDFHNPRSCFPSQGWNLFGFREVKVRGQRIKAMTADQDGDKLQVFYWRTGYRPPPPQRNALRQKLYAFRVGFIGKEEGMPLFVRVIAPDDGKNTAVMSFLEQIQAPIQALTRE